MKTNAIFIRCFAVALVSLICLGLTTPSLQAQTYAGRPFLSEQPGSLEATIYPILNSSRIKISFDRPGSGAVRIQIRDERGTVWHEQFAFQRRYRGQFDLSGLPAGIYQVSLQTDDAQYATAIQIAPSVGPRISLITRQPTVTPEKLIVANQ